MKNKQHQFKQERKKRLLEEFSEFSTEKPRWKNIKTKNNETINAVENILERHELFEGYEENVEQQKEWRLLLDSINNKISKNNVFKNLGERKQKEKLGQLGLLIEAFQYITSRKYVTPIIISLYSKRNLRIFGSTQSIRTVIKSALDTSLIYCVDSSYSFGPKYNKAKVYIWNKRVQDLLKELISEYNIDLKRDKSKVVNGVIDEDVDIDEVTKTFIANNRFTGFSSNMRLRTDASDAVINTALRIQYPQLKHYQDLANEMNSVLPLQDQIVFEPKITRNEKRTMITKIGIRYHSDFCNTDGMDRNEALKSSLGDRYYAFDVKSSIFRVTFMMNTGYWADNSFDFYPEMFGGEMTREERSIYKGFAMLLYFSPSIDYLFEHTSQIWLANVFEQMDIDVKTKITKDVLRDMIDSMYGAVGCSWGSEIFLHESCIYLDVQNELLKSGANVSTCYDSFYWSYPEGEGKYNLSNIEGLVKNCALNYYKTWILPYMSMQRYPEYFMTRDYVDECLERDYNEMQEKLVIGAVKDI